MIGATAKEVLLLIVKIAARQLLQNAESKASMRKSKTSANTQGWEDFDEGCLHVAEPSAYVGQCQRV